MRGGSFLLTYQPEFAHGFAERTSANFFNDDIGFERQALTPDVVVDSDKHDAIIESEGATMPRIMFADNVGPLRNHLPAVIVSQVSKSSDHLFDDAGDRYNVALGADSRAMWSRGIHSIFKVRRRGYYCKQKTARIALGGNELNACDWCVFW